MDGARIGAAGATGGDDWIGSLVSTDGSVEVTVTVGTPGDEI